ncbi:MAG: hypothetical protein GY861_13110 [bacterium]|nr:hypothetical protein [bacterium]
MFKNKVTICLAVGCWGFACGVLGNAFMHISDSSQKTEIEQQLVIPLLKFCKSTVIVSSRNINLEDNTAIFDCGYHDKSVYQINYKTLEVETLIEGEEIND